MDGPAELELALKRIAGGSSTADDCESEVLDFKEDNGRSQGDLTKIIAEAAICFANAAGGTIVVGVADKVKGRAAFTGTKLEPREVIQRVHDLSQPRLMVSARRHLDAHFAKTGRRFRQLKDSSFAKSRTAWRRWFSVA
jgi:ATP-dependent DNA helicase RecG